MKSRTLIPLVLCAAIILGSVLFLALWNDDDGRGDIDQRINELYDERGKINYEIEKCRNELEALTVTHAGIFFLFSHPEKELVSSVAPALEKYGHTATVSVSPEEFESEDIYFTLKEMGWSFSMGFADNFNFSQEDEDAMAELEEHILKYKAKGNIPDIINFSYGNAAYRPCFDEILVKYNIKTLIAPKIFLAAGSGYLGYDSETDILKIPSTPFSMVSTVETAMRNNINQKTPLAFATREVVTGEISAVSENLSFERFSLMLEYLDKYEDVIVGDCVEYRNTVSGVYGENSKKYAEIREKMNSFKDRVAELDEEIKSLRNGGEDD